MLSRCGAPRLLQSKYLWIDRGFGDYRLREWFCLRSLVQLFFCVVLFDQPRLGGGGGVLTC